ncbi:MAG: dihydrolipoyl dehydrogenase [Planctomycetaceae bacterium]|nr:dihydrolipoyl dehydrogenase [Planctomycetaceae bacterium]
MADMFDVVVIGGGPGGYSAAIRCAQKGARTAIVEKNIMGGTCLNVGCIPSKSLLASAHFLIQAKHAALMGLDLEGSFRPNWRKMVARKDAIVSGFTKGVTGLLQSNNVAIYNGTGVVTAPGKIRVSGAASAELEAKTIILATGSEPVNIGAFPFDYKTIISSTEALSLPSIPQSMVIIGGGVIGCEMACIYAAVGTKVTIIEALSQLLPNEDEWVAGLLEKEFKKLGITVQTSCKVTGVQTTGAGATVQLESGQSIACEKVLVAVGRRAKVDAETVKNLGLQMKGTAIAVNEKMQTSAAGVYAIGDAVATTYLAHGAFQEAQVAVANALGGDEKMTPQAYALIPRAVYSFPEVGSIGLTEKKARAMAIDCIVGKAPFRSNGRSVSHNETIGEIRVLRERASHKILGVNMVGASVTEMLAAARALIGSAESIDNVCFAHPTVSEVLKEAWEDAFGVSLHVPPTKK